MTVQLPRTSHKLVAPTFDYENTHFKKKAAFPGNPTALTLFSKVPQSTILSI